MLIPGGHSNLINKKQSISFEGELKGNVLYKDSLIHSDNFKINDKNIILSDKKLTSLTFENEKGSKLAIERINYDTYLKRILLDTLDVKVFDNNLTYFNNKNISKNDIIIEYKDKFYRFKNKRKKKRKEAIEKTTNEIPFDNDKIRVFLNEWFCSALACK